MITRLISPPFKYGGLMILCQAFSFLCLNFVLIFEPKNRNDNNPFKNKMASTVIAQTFSRPAVDYNTK